MLFETEMQFKKISHHFACFGFSFQVNNDSFAIQMSPIGVGDQNCAHNTYSEKKREWTNLPPFWAQAVAVWADARRTSHPLLSCPFDHSSHLLPVFPPLWSPPPLLFLSFGPGSLSCWSRGGEGEVIWHILQLISIVEFALTHKWRFLAVGRGYVPWAWGRWYVGGGLCCTRWGREKTTEEILLFHSSTFERKTKGEGVYLTFEADRSALGSLLHQISITFMMRRTTAEES